MQKLGLILRCCLLLFMLGSAEHAHGQFHFFSAEAQYLVAPTQGSQVGGSISWGMQVSAHHGFGLELTLPFYLKSNVATQYEAETEAKYDADLAWKRRMLPFPGLRYRLFVGNAVYIGASFNAGIIKEEFSAVRGFTPGILGYTEAIPSVNIQNSIRSPFFRINLDAGCYLNSGEHMFWSFNGKIGFQKTNPPRDPFGTFALNSDGDTRFRPYHGMDIFASFSIGVGYKR